jgi:hypothetical protein
MESIYNNLSQTQKQSADQLFSRALPEDILWQHQQNNFCNLHTCLSFLFEDIKSKGLSIFPRA